MTEYLIPRDDPIPRGTKIEAKVTSWYVIEVGDEILDATEEAITFAEMERRLGPGKTYDCVRNIERDYDREDVGVEWLLPARVAGAADSFRFPSEWEYATGHGNPQYRRLADVLAEAKE